MTEAWQEDARALIAQGHKIDAIKLVRQHTHCGLKDAKDYVDALAAGQSPPVPVPPPPGAKSGCAAAVVLLIAAGWLVSRVFAG